MRRSIKRWLGWAMSELLPAPRPRPQPKPVHIRYEVGGLSVLGTPVPWNAEMVIVEIAARLPANAKLRSDYTFRIPGEPYLTPDTIRQDDRTPGLYRIIFRIPTPLTSICGEVLWRQKLLTAVEIPLMSREQYAAELSLHHAQLSVRLGQETVAAETFVSSQCRGIFTSALVRSPVGLAPISELGIRVIFRNETLGEVEVPARLAASQLGGREAIVTVQCPWTSNVKGEVAACWVVGGESRQLLRVRGVSKPDFIAAMRAVDARFAIVNRDGNLSVVRQMPTDVGPSRVGPCFVVANSEPGAAGQVELSIVPVDNRGSSLPAVYSDTVLIGEGRTIITPGLLSMSDLSKVYNFELRYKSQVLGVLALRPAPTAVFDAEGGFMPPPDFRWSPTAEAELIDRLEKLILPD